MERAPAWVTSMHGSPLLVATLLAVLAVPAHAAPAQWITFPSAPPEALDGEHDPAHALSPVRAYLSIPVRPGPHPGVVMLPSCDGQRAYHQSWARALSGRGYVALVVDNYFMHDRGRSCLVADPRTRAGLMRMRLLHALGAADYLAGRPEVDGKRLAVMGWGDAPIAALTGAAGFIGAKREVFDAGVVVSPTLCEAPAAPPAPPMLVLRAASGAGPSGAACGEFPDAPGLEVRVYEGTTPGFDDPRAGSRTTGAARGSTRQPGRYDRLAHARAIEDVAAFLDRELQADPREAAHRYASTPTPPPDEIGTWALDLRRPGPDLPPAGGSAFDAVFSRVTPDGVAHDVPFPFSRLLSRLEQAAGGASMPRSPLDATLIPIGRSLQREAAAPDYFESPRVVVAVTGEPESGEALPRVRLKNRLFLGYQPRSKVIEVISYNEAAGRFEFQLVRDYEPGRRPDVRYAKRALCASCHQNQAPIFADASWGETTANARIVRRLGGLGQRFHGVAVDEADRAVAAIDTATDEANLHPIYQRLWSEGCASPERSEVLRCRAGALQAMVQYRLSVGAGFARTTPLYADGYLPLQRRNWRRRWPDGLLVPSPNLPNRSPLMSPSPSVVPVALDPLRRRPPLARWESSSARDLDRLVRGLSHELPRGHMRLLDRHLREQGAGAPGREVVSTCQVIRRGVSGRPRLIQLECEAGPRSAEALLLRAEVQVAPDGGAAGHAQWLEIGGGSFARLALAGRARRAQGRRRIELRFVGNFDERGVRAPDGGSVVAFTVEWDERTLPDETRFRASGTLAIAEDFRPVASALSRMASQDADASPLLAARFDGHALSTWLLTEIGALPASGSACCDRGALPRARLDADGGPATTTLSVALEHRGPVLTLRRYCGACHGGETTYPPGFLGGGGETTLRNVKQCAERIYFRLSMWSRPTEQQSVPPMPPIQGLSLAGTTPGDWRRSEALERLRDYAARLLTDEGRDPRAVLDGEFHDARSCLAARE